MRVNISFIAPCFNEQEWIPRLLLSLNSFVLDFDLIEFIVVDNWSSDKTVDRVWELIPNLNYRVRIVHESRPGVSHARNAGGMAASGETLVFIDADNLLTQKFIDELFFVHGLPNFCGSTIRTLAEPGSFQSSVLFYILELIKIIFPRPFGKSVATKAAFLNVGGFNADVKLGENVYFTLSLKKYAKNNSLLFLHISSPIYCSMRRFKIQGCIKVLIPWFFAYIGVKNIPYGKFND